MSVVISARQCHDGLAIQRSVVLNENNGPWPSHTLILNLKALRVT